jgi:hypothetical protein
VVKPGADPQQIWLAYRGATVVRRNAAGQLEVTTPVGSLHDDKPYFNGSADAFVAKISDVQRPEQVILAPPADTNPVGTSHTVTATVLDSAAQPMPDVTVRFSVTGSVNTTGSCTTDADGQCDFTYAGPQLPGADLISAYADTDNDNVQDPDEPEGAATKAWVLPTSTPGHVTGGGHILAANLSDEIAFGFNARSTDRGFTGNCNVIDLSTEPKTHIKCVDVTALVQTPDAERWGDRYLLRECDGQRRVDNIPYRCR